MDHHESKQRSLQQNKALHKWFNQVSQTLDEAGLDVRTTLKPDFEIQWSPELVKEILWRQAQRIALGKESTTELTTAEVNIVYELINRFLAKHGIHIPFPHDVAKDKY